MVSIPETPSSRFFRYSCRSCPLGAVSPTPVITIRLFTRSEKDHLRHESLRPVNGTGYSKDGNFFLRNHKSLSKRRNYVKKIATPRPPNYPAIHECLGRWRRWLHRKPLCKTTRNVGTPSDRPR